MRHVPTIACALLLAGCYSTSLHGDARSDPATDTGSDVLVDSGADTTGPDTPDLPPDILPDGTETCVPAGDGVWLSWTLDEVEWDEDREITTPCRIRDSWTDDTGTTVIDMLCGTGAMMVPHTIEIFSSAHPWMEFWEGADLMLNYVSRAWGEVNERWFALRWYEGSLILAGVSATTLAPPGYSREEWYYPVGVSLATGLCPAVDEGCGPRERAALDVTFMDERDLVFDGNSGIVGGIAIVVVTVGSAHYYEHMICVDLPSQWVGALFELPPEG